MSGLQVPTVTIEDLQAFQAKHFPGSTPVASLDYTYSGSVDEEYDEEDDGLGYYADGVKRTLTDEQIEIFRHSEIHSLLRERRLREEALAEESRDIEAEKAGDEDIVGASSDTTAHQLKEMSQGCEGASRSEQHKTHDTSVKTRSGKARSRGDLDYDEGNAGTGKTHRDPQFTGRRIISYAD